MLISVYKFKRYAVLENVFLHFSLLLWEYLGENTLAHLHIGVN